MSWLYSFIFAGMLFSSQSSPIYTNEVSNTPNAPRIIQTEETERFEKSYPLNATGRVRVSNVSGSIIVTGWDKNEVKLEAVKVAESKERLADMEIKVDARQDSFNVETEYKAWKNKNGGWERSYSGKYEVQYRLSVPRGAILDGIETVNGTVTISNTNNVTKASAVNGNVKAINLRGTAEIETVNGVTEADFETLENSSKISLSTVNGQIRLVIPSDSDATIKAETVNGRINNDFGLPVRKEKYSAGRDLYGKVGNGNAVINLESVNGELSVLRKQDGKNLKPATNLLSDNGNDVDRQIRESRVKDAVRVAQISRNANVDKAMREAEAEVAKANIEAAKAMADAQKEMAKARVNVVIPNVVATINTEQMQKEIAAATQIQAKTLARLDRINWEWKSSVAPTVERKSETFPVKGTPKVNIDAKNCKIFVRGWDKSEVKYSIVRLAKGADQKPLAYTADNTDSSVTLKVNPNEGEEGNDQIRIEVFVPKKSNLRILTDKEIRVEGVSGDINLTGENDSINVRDSFGKLTVAANEGAIRVIGFNGEIDSKTVNGNINLEGIFQKLNARTEEGTIVLTLPEDANATLKSNTDINSEGFELIKDKNQWKIGEGGANYILQSNDGQIFVRNINEIKNTF